LVKILDLTVVLEDWMMERLEQALVLTAVGEISFSILKAIFGTVGWLGGFIKYIWMYVIRAGCIVGRDMLLRSSI
jgi:hypothetical protein